MVGKSSQEQYPVFVYGSLMSGLHNAGLLHPSVDLLSPGHVTGFALRSMRDVFPYAIEGESTSDVVVGEICWIKPAHYNRVLARLDRLEGVDSGHYDRGLVLVTLDDGSPDVLSWMYTATPEVAEDARASLPEVDGGDWRLHLSQIDVSDDEAGAGW